MTLELYSSQISSKYDSWVVNYGCKFFMRLSRLAIENYSIACSQCAIAVFFTWNLSSSESSWVWSLVRAKAFLAKKESHWWEQKIQRLERKTKTIKNARMGYFFGPEQPSLCFINLMNFIIFIVALNVWSNA